jgi:HEAT repeat protein
MPIIKQYNPQVIQLDERQVLRDYAGLVSELYADNPTARRWAARDLVAYPESAELLVKQLCVEEEPSVRDVILTTLTRLASPVAVNGLLEYLRSEDVALRNEVIEALQQLPEQVAPVMAELLVDADPDVRIFTVNILESLCHPNVEAWLIATIERDTHINVCASALDLLVEVGSIAALPALRELKQRFPDEPYIAFAVDLAIKRIEKG